MSGKIVTVAKPARPLPAHLTLFEAIVWVALRNEDALFRASPSRCDQGVPLIDSILLDIEVADAALSGNKHVVGSHEVEGQLLDQLRAGAVLADGVRHGAADLNRIPERDWNHMRFDDRTTGGWPERAVVALSGEGAPLWLQVTIETASLMRAFPAPATAPSTEDKEDGGHTPHGLDQIVTSGADVITSGTGTPGRPPKARVLWMAEAQRRAAAGERYPSKAALARELLAWLATTHPLADRPTEKTLKNSLADFWARHRPAVHKGWSAPIGEPETPPENRPEIIDAT